MAAQYFEEAYGKRRGFTRCQKCKQFPSVLHCYPHWFWWLVAERYCEDCDPNITWRRTPITQIQFNGKK